MDVFFFFLDSREVYRKELHLGSFVRQSRVSDCRQSVSSEYSEMQLWCVSPQCVTVDGI